MESDITDAEAFAAAYPVGAPVRAVSVGLVSDADGRRAAVQELTARKEAVSSAEAGRPVKPKLVFDAAAPGRSITGCDCSNDSWVLPCAQIASLVWLQAD